MDRDELSNTDRTVIGLAEGAGGLSAAVDEFAPRWGFAAPPLVWPFVRSMAWLSDNDRPRWSSSSSNESTIGPATGPSEVGQPLPLATNGRFSEEAMR